MFNISIGVLLGLFAGLLVPFLNGELKVISAGGVIATFACYFGFAFTVIGTVVGLAAVKASTLASNQSIKVSKQTLHYQMLDKRYNSVLSPLMALLNSVLVLNQKDLSKLPVRNTRYYDHPEYLALLNSWAQASNMLRVLYNDDREELWQLAKEVISYSTKLIDSQSASSFSINKEEVEKYGMQLVIRLIALSKVEV